MGRRIYLANKKIRRLEKCIIFVEINIFHNNKEYNKDLATLRTEQATFKKKKNKINIFPRVPVILIWATPEN
jgi:hypothetical protein